MLLPALVLVCLLAQPVQSSSSAYSIYPEAWRSGSQVKGKAVATGPQRIVIIPVEFPDRKHQVSIGVFRSIFAMMNNYYREVSYGMVEITGDVLQKWYTVQTPLSKLDIQIEDYDESDMMNFRQEAISAADPDVNYANYDFVYIVVAGEVTGNAFRGRFFYDGVGWMNVVVLSEDHELMAFVHELGHLLPSRYPLATNLALSVAQYRENQGLPDLYDDAHYESEGFVGTWDIMGNNVRVVHFSAWSKIMLGWVTPETTHLNSTMFLAVNLQPLEKSTGLRAVVINIDRSVSYVVEVRRRIGWDSVLPAEGVLIYLVDLQRIPGHGVLRLIDKMFDTSTLDDAPFKQGDSFEDAVRQLYVTVAYTNGTGYFVVAAGDKALLKDSDNDGLLDVAEKQLGTDPHNPDTDGDGIKDGDEVNHLGTDPLSRDIVITTTMVLTTTHTETVTEKSITMPLSATLVVLGVMALSGVLIVVLLKIWKRKSCIGMTSI